MVKRSEPKTNTPEETRKFIINDFIKEAGYYFDENDKFNLYGEFYCAMDERNIEKKEYEPLVEEFKKSLDYEKEKEKRNKIFSDIKDNELNRLLEEISSLEPVDQDVELEKLAKDKDKKLGVLKKQLTLINKKKQQQSSTIKNFGKQVKLAFDKTELARGIIEKCPMHYDKSKMWLIWNEEESKFEMVDETDILNMVKEVADVNTTNRNEKSEIIEALKQVARKNRPKDKPKGWVQFKDILVDPRTEDEVEATSEYLLMTPIPHKLGKSEDTPTISRLLREWAVKDGVQDESYITSLEEAAAYALTDDQFMQRMFPLTGGGCNGKGTYLEFIQTLVGKENCVSVDLKKLCTNNFALSAIYKKLVAITGEVSHNDLSNTNVIKKLTGEDKIEFEFKGKTSFTDESITSFFLPTNSLPITPEKSVGFYRRNQIIDFPNTFQIKPHLLECIPEWEYENFCLKCVRILKRLYVENKFTNEGSYEQREQKYEERSNPLPKFIEECCEDDAGEVIKLQEFSIRFNQWLKEKRLKPLTVRDIGKMIRNEGYGVGKRAFSKTESHTCILNLSLNDTQNNTNNTNNTEKGSWFPIGKVTGSAGINSITGIIPPKEIEQEVSEEPQEPKPDYLEEVQE